MDDIEQDSIISKFQHQLIIWICIISFVLSSVFFIIGLFKPANYQIGVIFQLIFIVITLILVYFKKYNIASSFFIIAAIGILIYQSYSQNSAMVFSAIGIFLIISSLLKDFWFTTVAFIISLVAMGILLYLRVFTFSQNFDPVTNIPLVNNIQIALPLLFVSYVYSYINTKIILRKIEEVNKKNKEIQKTQDLLISQARIESIRLLAGGFAHDFNNLLTGILGNISLGLNDENLSETTRSCLEDAQQASIQTRNLVQQLFTFSKDHKPSISHNNNFAELLENTIKISLVGRKSQAITQIDKDLFGFNGDPVKISQVIQNFLINADQSMEGGKTIKINARNKTLEEENKYNLPPGDYIYLEVIDQGIGIRKENYNKLFQPFFTTKENGTGLGLAISKIIIENHKGYLNFKSEINKGSTFYFLLPGIPLKSTEIDKNSSTQIYSSALGLILDDNRNVLKVLEYLLADYGIKAIGVSESTSFINILKKT